MFIKIRSSWSKVSFIVSILATHCLASGNPAAIYCETMGYQYTDSVCTFTDNSSANAWNFYRGKVAQSFSYCEKNGYRMQTDYISQKGYTVELPVCVSDSKERSIERIPMIEMMKQRGDMSLEKKIPMRVHSLSGTQAPKINKRAVLRTSYPASFDWRNYNGHTYIGPVRDQACSDCYTFAVAAAGEGVYNYAHGKYDLECVDFSESYIAWCLGKYGPYSSHFGGCGGSDYEYAELTAITNDGVTYEANFPYIDSDPGSCTHQNDPVITFKEWGRIDSNDTLGIQWALSTHGVIEVAVNVTTNFNNYSEGIFSDSQTSCPDGAYTVTDHAVALVGWGVDNTEGLYWILRNSWGLDWGEDGYMRIQANSARVACAGTYLVAKEPLTLVPIYHLILD